MKKILFLITFIIIALTVKSEQLKVGLYESPPFVMMDINGSYTGLIIDIWEKIVKENNIDYIYETYNGSINSITLAKYNLN